MGKKLGPRRLLQEGDVVRGMTVTNPYCGRDAHGKALCEIRCHCGRLKITRRSGLTTTNSYLQTHSCGCLSKALVNQLIDEQIRSIPLEIRELIAQEVELGWSTPEIQETALLFGVTGKVAVNVCRRIRRQVREKLWDSLGPNLLNQVWVFILQVGTVNAQRRLRQNQAWIRMIIAWAKREIPGAKGIRSRGR
jgi:hypothetical protein